MISAEEVERHIEVLKSEASPAGEALKSLKFLVAQWDSSDCHRYFLPERLPAYIQVGKNHLRDYDIAQVLLDALPVLQERWMLQDKPAVTFESLGVYEYLIDVVTAEAPLWLFKKVLKLMPDTLTIKRSAFPLRDRFLAHDMLDKWGAVVQKLPSVHKCRPKLVNAIADYLIIRNDEDFALPKDNPENVARFDKFFELVSGEGWSKGVYDASDYSCSVLLLPREVRDYSDYLTDTEKRKVQVEILGIKGHELAAKDRNGFSDPFIVAVRVKDKKEIWKSKVIKKTLNPVWDFSAKPVKFELESITSCVSFYVWDDDLIGKDYMGMCALVPGFEYALQNKSGRDSITVNYTLRKSGLTPETYKRHKNIKGIISIQYRITLI